MSKQQDMTERGVWGALEYVNGAGAVMSVRATGTTELELPVMNMGYGFNLPGDSDAEVLMLSLGSDVNDKVAVPMIPRDKLHQWGEGEGGVQHPTDPDRRLEYNDNETFLRDGKFVIGSNREVTVTVDGTNVTIQTGGNATITASNVKINGNLDVQGNITSTGTVKNNGKDIGSTHRHSGVDTGGGTSGVPV